MRLSIVIPCYKSEKTIEKVVNEVVEEMNNHKQEDYEIILVNDGSRDNTFSIIKNLALNNNHILAINLAKNFGQYPALMAGYAKVTGDYIVTMDDDGEHHPSEIFRLVEKLEEGYDYVCADFANYNRQAYKSLGSKFNYWFLKKMMDMPDSAMLSAFNITRKFVIDQILLYDNPKPYVDGMIMAITNNMSSIKIEHGERYGGSSNYSFSNSFSLWLNGVTSYSIKPLRIAAFMGMIFAFSGFLLGLLTVIDKLLHPQLEAGYASIFSVILFIGGFLMLFLGIIGEYIGRMYLINNHIPQYVIREVVKKD